MQARCFNAVDVSKATLDAVAACDWTLFVEQEPDSKRLLPLRLRVTFNTVLFTRERVDELLAQVHVLSRLVAGLDPCRPGGVDYVLPRGE
jgi:hypothetical protein